MDTNHQENPEPSPEEASHFLSLLTDVNQLQEELLKEAAALRARVLELEARPATGPAPGVDDLPPGPAEDGPAPGARLAEGGRP